MYSYDAWPTDCIRSGLGDIHRNVYVQAENRRNGSVTQRLNCNAYHITHAHEISLIYVQSKLTLLTINFTMHQLFCCVLGTHLIILLECCGWWRVAICKSESSLKWTSHVTLNCAIFLPRLWLIVVKMESVIIHEFIEIKHRQYCTKVVEHYAKQWYAAYSNLIWVIKTTFWWNVNQASFYSSAHTPRGRTVTVPINKNFRIWHTNIIL